MTKTIRTILLGAAFCLAANASSLLGLAPPAAAAPNDIYSDTPAQKAKPKKAKKSKKRRAKKTSASSSGWYGERGHVRSAQVYLDQLGYDPGPADGLMGPHTRSAIKAFQRDQKLPRSGKLDKKTFARLSEEAGSRSPSRNSEYPTPDFIAMHPDFYGYYGPDYTNPNMLGTPQAISTRFGTADISEQPNGPTRNYVLTLNGQTVYHAENQPSPINISRTFNLDNADAILITSFSNNTQCPYRHSLLVMRTSGSGMHDIADCTRDVEAYSKNGMLLISFPGPHTDGVSKGAAWRYDNGLLEKL
ncbi:MAG: peptidoglycan-binding protein [Bdellovibrionales bacterium]